MIGRSRPPQSSIFPLTPHSSGRYLVQSNGTPFLLHGDTPWSLEVQCTPAQVRQYLNDRQARGFTMILFEGFEKLASSQTPKWQNANGDIPFTGMSGSSVPFTAMVPAYWTFIKTSIYEECIRVGIVPMMNPAYLGFGGTGSEGWNPAVQAASTAELYAYGQSIGQMFPFMLWCAGGDYAGTTAERDQQWFIYSGIRSVNPYALITGHPARADGDSWSLWGPGGQNYAGFNLNSIYTPDTGVVSEAATAYGRAGPMPFIGIEFYYENEHSMTTNGLAVQALQCYYSGGCGAMFGNNPLWGLGSPPDNGGAGAQNSLDTAMKTAGAESMTYIQRLLRAYAWHSMQPKTDNSVITTALGSGVTAICPARASDGSFAHVLVNTGSSITFDNTCITHTPTRRRWYDPTAGVFVAPAEGQAGTNTGTTAFSFPGANASGGNSWVLVVD